MSDRSAPMSGGTQKTLGALFACAALGACVTAPEPSTTATGCIESRFPEDTRVADSEFDSFVGSYARENHFLSIRREEYRMLLNVPGSGTRELRFVQDWRFEDGCGTAYEFAVRLAPLQTVLKIRGRDGSAYSWSKLRS